MAITLQTGEWPLPKGMTNGPTSRQSGGPIMLEGEAITIHLAEMEVGLGYPTIYRNKPAIAIKAADGSVAFYRLPK